MPERFFTVKPFCGEPQTHWLPEPEAVGFGIRGARRPRILPTPMASRRLPAFCIVLTTYAKPSVGRRIVRALLGSRLAACVQDLPVTSAYTWKGRVVRGREHLLLVKARKTDVPAVRDMILSLHDYEVPEVVALDIAQGSSGYLRWMAEVTG